MAYVKKLSQFLYCGLYVTTLTIKHKEIHSFYPFTVACKQLFVVSKQSQATIFDLSP